MGQRGRPRHPDVLTPREQDVLALIREGLTNEQIAERLGVSFETAKAHVGSILSKLNVTTREEASAWRPEERPARWPIVIKVALAAAALAVLAGVVLLALLLLGSSDDENALAVPTALASTTQTSGAGQSATVTSMPQPTLTTAPSSTSSSTVAAGTPGWSDCPAIAGQDLPVGLFQVMDATTCQITTISGITDASSVTWSPDSRQVAFLRSNDYLAYPKEDDIWVAYVEGSSVVRITDTPGIREEAPSWSPDGQRLLFATFDNSLIDPAQDASLSPNQRSLVIANLQSGSFATIATGLECLSQFKGFEWAPDGGRVAVASGCNGDTYVQIIDVSSGRGTPLEGATALPAWQPGGDLMVFSCALVSVIASNLCIADSTGTVQRAVLLSSFPDDPSWTEDYMPITGSQPIWSNDGSFLAFQGAGRVGGGFYIYPINGERGTIVHDLAYPAWLSNQIAIYSECHSDLPSGVSVSVCNRPAELVSRRLDTGEKHTIFTAWCGTAGATWSPDGHKIAYSTAVIGTCF